MLSLATQDSDNPDLRDRGFIYWRLLSTDPGAAKEVSWALSYLLKCFSVERELLLYIYFDFIFIVLEVAELQCVANVNCSELLSCKFFMLI